MYGWFCRYPEDGIMEYIAGSTVSSTQHPSRKRKASARAAALIAAVYVANIPVYIPR